MSHIPEPWEVCWRGDVVSITNGHLQVVRRINAANAARIVACVNACAGMAEPAREIEQLREIVALFVREAYERHQESNAEDAEERRAWRAMRVETLGVLLRQPIVAELMRKYTREGEKDVIRPREDQSL